MSSGSLAYLKNRRESLKGERSVQDSLNVLLYGDYGTGKTHFLSTCRRPIYIFSFDPGGTKIRPLQEMERKGVAILDTAYEAEDSKRPSAFAAFDRTHNEMKSNDAYSVIGTVAIDSLTTFCDAAMNFILKKEGRAGGHPQIQDYFVLQNLLSQVFREFCNLPCDFVLTGHVDTMKDDVSGKIITSLMIPGKNATKVPVLFDEVLMTWLDVDSKKNINYKLRLKGDSKFKTSARAFSGPEFEIYEEPNMMELRKKANKSVEHLGELT